VGIIFALFLTNGNILPINFYKKEIAVKILFAIICSFLFYTETFAQDTQDTEQIFERAQNSVNKNVVLANAISSVTLSMASLANLQLSMSLVGTAATTVSGVAVATAGGSGYFFGSMVIKFDKLYLDGVILNSVGKVLEPAFFVTYQIQSAIQQ
jgi:hypothetical protein